VTSTSSESDNEFLEPWRPAASVLADLEDDEELPEPDDDDDDDNDDENEDDFDDVLAVVGVSMVCAFGKTIIIDLSLMELAVLPFRNVFA